MAYIRDPRYPLVWESDGGPPFGKYRANDGTIYDTPREAIKHDERTASQPESKLAAPRSGERKEG
jgi:hypothetical protein